MKTIASIAAVLLLAVALSGQQVVIKDPTTQNPAGVANGFLQTSGFDPCSRYTKLTATKAFSSATAQELIAPAPGLRNMVCSIHFHAQGTAEIGSVWEGTKASTPCDTGKIALDGSTTAASGVGLSASGGYVYGNGTGTIYAGVTPNAETCVVTSGSNAVTVSATYVQVP